MPAVTGRMNDAFVLLACLICHERSGDVPAYPGRSPGGGVRKGAFRLLRFSCYRRPPLITVTIE